MQAKAQVIQNIENVHIPIIGQSEGLRREYKMLKLGSG
jgi:hypothetical protein